MSIMDSRKRFVASKARGGTVYDCVGHIPVMFKLSGRARRRYAKNKAIKRYKEKDSSIVNEVWCVLRNIKTGEIIKRRVAMSYRELKIRNREMSQFTPDIQWQVCSI